MARPPDSTSLRQQGLAQRGAGNLPAAAAAFEAALRVDAQDVVARLHLGTTLIALGQHSAAIAHCYRAIRTAQDAGRWVDDASIEPKLRPEIIHAMHYTARGRREWLEESLRPARAKYGDAALQRVDRCLAIHLGEVDEASPDLRQAPRFLYFPGLPPQPYLAVETVPWLERLDSAAADMRREALQIMQRPEITPFLGSNDSPQSAEYLKGSRGAPAWDAYFLYRHGARLDENCARCPQTAALLDSLPLVRIRDHAPEICFSILRPGTHILPHRGLTNTRVVVHVPLVVPQNCGLRVAGATHVWQEGKCVMFDDTYEHEAWNDSDTERVIVLMDTWNPHLTAIEKEALSALIPAIGAFNRAWQSC